MKRVDLAGVGLDVTSGTPLVLLREQEEPRRLVPIFVGQAEAAAIAVAVSGEVPSRPLTHDVMASLIRHFDAHVDAVEVTELSEGAFLATLAMHGPTGEQTIDTRPSDAIALAVRLGAPLFVSDVVLDEVGILPPVQVDEVDEVHVVDDEGIDATVEEFRSFLEEVDPSQFAEGISGSTDVPEDGS